MADAWESAVKAATKILGPKAKIPKYPSQAAKDTAEINKEYERYVKVRDELEKIVLKLQDLCSAGKNSDTQFLDKIEDEDFGLDAKNKDDVKKIEQAQKVLCDYLNSNIKTGDDNVKNLRELNKHLDSLSKYKSPAS